MKPHSFLLPLMASFLSLAGCAALPAPAVAVPEAERRAAADPGSVPARPVHALTPEIFYGVITSEIAAQRGGTAVSAQTYLALARQLRDARLAERAAQFGLISGQLTTATAALQLWVELEPDAELAREQLLVAQLRAGKFAESRQLVEPLLRKSPARAAAIFVQLARLSVRQNNKDAAYQLVQDLAQPFPALPEARFAVLATAADAGDDAAVSRELDTLATLAPKWDLPVLWQVDRLRQQDNERALAFLAAELARRPQAGMELRLAYPRLLVSARRMAEARTAFEAELVRYPGQADILYALGLLTLQLQALDAAGPYLEGALKAGHPEADYLRLMLGQWSEARNDRSAAQRWYTEVGSGPHFLSAQVRLAALDAKDGDIATVLERMDALGGSSAEKVQLALFQSQFARQAGRADLAERHLGRALQAQPATPELLYERALVYEQQGKLVLAEQDLKAYLKEKPDDAQGLNALGYLLANRTRRYREALALIERANQVDPDNPMILDSLGWVHYKLGRNTSALRYLEAAYAKLPDPEVAAHLGEVLWQLGRKDEARALWQAVLSKHPEHEVLKETMTRLQP